MNISYPEYRKHLRGMMVKLRKRIPGAMEGYSKLHAESMKPGSLSEKQKELISLGIGITSRCDGCIAFHTYEALGHGASADEINETIAVAIAMGGGPALMYAAHAVEALEQFQAEQTG